MKNNLYLDTNIFLYLSQPNSEYHKECQELIRECKKANTTLLTSAETIQEIIYYSKNVKQLSKGLKAAKTTLTTVDELLPIDSSTIEIYLEKTKVYKSATSRDVLHLSTCITNKVDLIVTHDRDFRKFKEVKALKPKEFLALLPQ